MKNRIKKLRISESGDTIIEVMVVLAVLSFAIIISYVSANRSLADARVSEENSYATEIGQSELEQVRNMAVTSQPSTSEALSNLISPQLSGATTGTPFCMTNGAAVLLSTASTESPDPCIHYLNGNVGSAAFNVSDTLTQTVQAVTTTGLQNVNTFTINITWPDALGEGAQDLLTLTYRAYAPYQL